MNSEFVTEAERDRIRDVLLHHMYIVNPETGKREGLKVSGQKVSRFINERPSVFKGFKTNPVTIERFLDMSAGTVRAQTVSALGLYLSEIEKIQPASRDIASTMFEATKAFFGMSDMKANQYLLSVVGTYAFYAYSEQGKSRVCRGAIEFSADESGNFNAREVQRSIPPGGSKVYIEHHDGHFLFRRNSMIVLLRASNLGRPKFYILSIAPYETEDGEKQVLTGALLKTGASQDVFGGAIYMVRKDTAFEECDMVASAEVPEEILEILDSQRWTAPPKPTQRKE